MRLWFRFHRMVFVLALPAPLILMRESSALPATPAPGGCLSPPPFPPAYAQTTSMFPPPPPALAAQPGAPPGPTRS